MNQTLVPSPLFSRIARGCAASAIVISCLVLLSWSTGAWQIGALGYEYVPMAPSTAWLIILLGGSVFLRHYRPSQPLAHWLARAAVIVTGFTSLVVLLRFIWGFELPVEYWLSQTSERVGGIPVGRMSPLSAMVFLAAALALLCGLPALARRRSCRQAAAGLALAALLVSTVVMLSYFLDAPLLYGRQTIPMAFPTAISMVLLNLGIIAGINPDVLPLSLCGSVFSGAPVLPSRWSVRQLIAIFSILAAGIGFLGYLYLGHVIDNSRQAVQKELSTIGELKSGQIQNWYQERMEDAEIIFSNPMIKARIRQFLAELKDGGEGGQDLSLWMESLLQQGHYHKLVLFDNQGTSRLWAPAALNIEEAAMETDIDAGLNAPGVRVADFHLCRHIGANGRQDIHLEFWIPFRTYDQAAGPADGVLLLQIDPADFLYPLVRSWPVPSNSAETLLVRREGDEVLFLNDLRHQANTALTLRLPITRRDLPAAMAVTGKTGVVEGLDYRSTPVLAAINAIPGTPWFMVAKIDQEEIYAPIRQRAWITGLVILFGLLIAGLGIGLLWWQRDNQWLRQRLAAEQEHQDLADRILALNQQANDLILLADQNWRILEANDRALAAYGYSLEEMQGLTAPDLRAPAVRAGFDRVAAEGDSEAGLRLETVHQRKDGSIFPVEISHCSVAIGGKRYRQAIIRDVTERKRAEAALQASEERFRTLVEASPDAIGLVSPDGDLVMANQQAAVILGYERVEELFALAGQSLFSLVAPPDRERAMADVSRVLETGILRDAEYLLLRRNGNFVPVEVNGATVRGSDAKRHGILVVVRDISGRKQAAEEKAGLEAQLAQAMKMEAVGRLAGGVAHDFNNLLTIILSYAGFVSKSLAANDPRCDDIKEVLKAGQRAADLTRQLLVFSRRQVLRLSLVNINDALASMDKMLRRLIGEDIEFVTTPGLDLWEVKTDLGQIEQVIMNLAVNARDAMPHGGTLVIATANVDLDEEFRRQHIGAASGPHVLLSVCDNGTGMDRETQQRIFEPFFTTKEQGKGTGLGLATVYGIVKQSNGFIEVESAPGMGTSFIIYLPKAVAEVLGSEKENMIDSSVDRGSETILLVEDDAEVLSTTREILKRRGYHILEALGGEEALEISASYDGPIHLLLTDVIMPRLSGIQLSTQLELTRPEMKTILMSGYSSDVIDLASIQASGFTFIQKPLQSATLLRSVREVLDFRNEDATGQLQQERA